MTGKTVVVFYFDKRKMPRVFKNPSSISDLQKEGNILVNPSIPKGIPPHKWKLKNGRIVAGLKIENVFPENKTFEQNSLDWFKPFVFSYIAIDIIYLIFENKEIFVQSWKKLQELF